MQHFIRTTACPDALRSLPNEPGIYFFRGPIPSAVRPKHRPPSWLSFDDLLYVGAADDLRRRITSHVRGGSNGSSFRSTLGATLREDLGLNVQRHLGMQSFDFGVTEERLTDWLVENTCFAFWTVEEPFAVERALLRYTPGALNITGRDRETATRLLALRREASTSDTTYEEVMAACAALNPRGLARSAP